MILVFALVSCVCAQKTNDPAPPGLPKEIEIVRARTWPQYHLPLIARYPQRLVEKLKLHPDSTDLPYMVKGDFNGDGIEDIAFMLSGEFGKSPPQNLPDAPDRDVWKTERLGNRPGYDLH